MVGILREPARPCQRLLPTQQVGVLEAFYPADDGINAGRRQLRRRIFALPFAKCQLAAQLLPSCSPNPACWVKPMNSGIPAYAVNPSCVVW